MNINDPDTHLLLVQDIALLVTIVGWLFTGAQQLKIVRESRRYNRIDRDLGVHRARMDKASDLSRSLIESADKWFKLAALAKAHLDEGLARRFQSSAMESGTWQAVMETRLGLGIILHDPQFRALRDLLRPEIAKKLYQALKDLSPPMQEFVERTYFLEPSDKNITDTVQYIVEQSKAIGQQLTDTADLFADAFAVLDKELAAAE